MSLADYTYIATLGQTCGPCFQLCRAAGAFRLRPEQLSGPFDWLLVNLKQVSAILSRDFEDYFCPRELAGIELRDGRWKLTDKSGVVAWHQLPAEDGAREPSPETWWAFGVWLGARVQLWQRHMNDPNGRLLFIRHESPFQADDAADVVSLLDVLRQRIAGQFRFVWVTYQHRVLDVDAPVVQVFQVRPAWPEGLAESAVDYDHDYGFGPAWRGRNEDWDNIWRWV